MRSYVLQREPEGLREDLGSGAGDVARLVSEVRDRVQVETRAAGDPEEERWRLLQAVGSFLRNASAVQPLLLILEDLHDADRGTLDLLVHLAHNLSGARLLIAGTYRDVEVDRSHPLSGAMAELRRGGNFLRVPLRGLTAEEVQRMMASASQQEIPWPLAELVHRQTEGNPLFVQEVLRYLVEERLVERRDGSLRRVGDETLAGRIPEGLRDVIGKRLNRLSEKTNQVLSVAAVVGREFRLDVLQQVLGIPEEELYAALEEANGAAVVEQRQATGTVGFRFTHAFFRQTLYEEIFVPRRIRVHQQVGRALEAVYGRRLEEHAAELAEHFAQSTENEDLRKALHYCELAAQRALRVYAYGEAARHLQRELKVQEVLAPDEKSMRCDLLLRLGEALIPAGEARQVVEQVAPEALQLSEAQENAPPSARVSLLALDALWRTGAGPATGTPEFAYWLEIADRCAIPGTRDRVRTDISLSHRERNGARARAAFEIGRRALNLARELNDEQLSYEAAAWLLNTALPEFQHERLALAEELAVGNPGKVSAGTLGLTMFNSILTFLTWCQRDRADEMWADLDELSERIKDPVAVIWSLTRPIARAVLDGELEEAIRLAETLRRRSAELGASGAGSQFAYVFTLRPLCYLGRAREAEDGQNVDARRAVAAGRSLVAAADTALFLTHGNRMDEAKPYLVRARESLAGPDRESDMSLRVLTLYLEAAVLAADHELASLIVPFLSQNADLMSDQFLTVIARHLAAASELLGDHEVARRYYDQALEVARKARFRPELALARFGLAELLLDHYPDERAEALGHLDFAIGEFREMKMRPSLERALGHKEVLKA